MEDGDAGVLAPSGRQLVIGAGSTRAVVTEVGASLRELVSGDEQIIWPYPVGTISDGGRGQVLFPWPNRIEDGSYEFNGTRAKAALDEPERHNAIHGLVRWLSWTVEESSTAEVRLSCALAAQPGYPWRVAPSLTYAAAEAALQVTAAVANQASTPAPIGLGFHPYLDAGADGVDDCSLALPADWHLHADDRGLPRGRDGVGGTPYDFRGGAPLSGMSLDDCFFGLAGDLSPGSPPDAVREARSW